MQLTKEFPEFGELHHWIEQYEKRADDESRFVYALDKIQPVIQIMLNGGRDRHNHKVSFSMLREKKDDKVLVSPEVAAYWEEIVEFLEANKERMFPKV